MGPEAPPEGDRPRLPAGDGWRCRAALSGLILAGMLSACGGEEPGEPPRPSFLVLSVDTLNRHELRAFDPGAQSLPNLDRFAQGALRFPEAFSTASWTLPAHASILTGLYPHRHGAVHSGVALRPQVETLAERLRSAGYRTVAFTHGGLLSRKYGLDRGFDIYDDHRSPALEHSALRLPDHGRVPEVPGAELFQRAITFLQARREADPPFFLFVHTYNVHDYFYANPWVRKPGEAALERPKHYLDCLQGARECSEREWSRLREYYSAEIRHLDAGLGRLLAALPAPSVGPTYVLLVSDHGEGFDPAAGRIHHAGRLHDDLIRVPLLLAGPGLEGGEVQAPVSVVDIAPTVLELAGVQVPPDLDGRPLPNRPFEQRVEPRNLFAFEYSGFWRSGSLLWLEAPSPRPLMLATISGDYRLIVHRSSHELYLVPEDPEQRLDLSRGRSEVAVSLLAVARPLLRHRLTPQPVRRGAALERELRALGYL